jgi:hypothetical protein
MDVEHRLALVEALHGTNDDTVCVFAVEARLTNGMGHAASFRVAALLDEISVD